MHGFNANRKESPTVSADQPGWGAVAEGLNPRMRSIGMHVVQVVLRAMYMCFWLKPLSLTDW